MKTHSYFSILFILFSATRYFDANAQGCAAGRQMVSVNPLSFSGYMIPEREFQIGTGYRSLPSSHNFVFTEEQPELQTIKNQLL